MRSGTVRLPRGPLDRIRWAVGDAYTIAGRDLTHWVQQPGQVVTGWLFLIMLLLMFGYVFGGGMLVPGGGGYREFLVPGMFAVTMTFGIETTYAAVAGDAAKGVTDRFRSMPMARSAVVVGRSLADMVNSVVGLAVLVGCGLAIGWRWRDGLGPALIAVALLLLLRFAMLWVGIWLALVLHSPETLVAVQILVWPVAFFSSVFAAPETMPGWLGAIVEWNPLSATASATRELFGNPGWGGESWAAEHAPALAVLWPVLLVAVFLPLSVRRYQRLSQ